MINSSWPPGTGRQAIDSPFSLPISLRNVLFKSRFSSPGCRQPDFLRWEANAATRLWICLQILPRLRSRLRQYRLSFLAPLVPHSNPLLRHHPPLIPLSNSLPLVCRRTVRTTDTMPPELTAVYILWTDILPSAVLLIFDIPV